MKIHHSYINIWNGSLLLDNKVLSLSDKEVVKLIEANVKSNNNIVQGSVTARVSKFGRGLKKCSLSFHHSKLGKQTVEFIVFSIRNSGVPKNLLKKRVQVSSTKNQKLGSDKMQSVCIYKTGDNDALFVGIDDNNFWKSEADNVTSAWFDLEDLYCLFNVGSFEIVKDSFRKSSNMKQYFTRDIIDFLFRKRLASVFKKDIEEQREYKILKQSFDHDVKHISNKNLLERTNDFLEASNKENEEVDPVDTLKLSREAEELVYNKIISKSFQRLNKFINKNSVVLWLNYKKESHRPLDILISSKQGSDVFIEVKTTQKKKKSFFLSENEKELLLKTINNKNEYFLVLVWNYKGGEASSIRIYSADEIKNKEDFREIKSYFYDFPN